MIKIFDIFIIKFKKYKFNEYKYHDRKISLTQTIISDLLMVYDCFLMALFIIGLMFALISEDKAEFMQMISELHIINSRLVIMFIVGIVATVIYKSFEYKQFREWKKHPYKEKLDKTKRDIDKINLILKGNSNL